MTYTFEELTPELQALVPITVQLTDTDGIPHEGDETFTLDDETSIVLLHLASERGGVIEEELEKVITEAISAFIREHESEMEADETSTTSG